MSLFCFFILLHWPFLVALLSSFVASQEERRKREELEEMLQKAQDALYMLICCCVVMPPTEAAHHLLPGGAAKSLVAWCRSVSHTPRAALRATPQLIGGGTLIFSQELRMAVLSARHDHPKDKLSG